jgi:hypothetical protein
MGKSHAIIPAVGKGAGFSWLSFYLKWAYN